ncbi:MAG: hypothetical protein SVR08_10750 [Spirochaetota bacterium]|nr:hypothetical protein [Spirochaetota bacterium]
MVKIYFLKALVSAGQIEQDAIKHIVGNYDPHPLLKQIYIFSYS